MEKITFCIPSKNNLRYLKSSVTSIKQNSTLDNEILVWVDQDDDGTEKWLKENNIKYLVNLKSEPQGIAAGYNRCIEAASNEIVCMFHADMFIGKGFDVNIIKHLKPKTVIAGTRIEPPLHPEGKEKIVKDFGMYPEDFKEGEFDEFVSQTQKEEKDQVTYGIFAPWACYKDEIMEMGMHDESFHSYHEDSDIFNRFILNGMKLIQSRDALVYHLTCRGGIFQDGIEEITQDKKFHTMKNKAGKNYLRKWGSWIKNNEYHHPIIPPKYDIGFRIENATLNLIESLEPWCNHIYTDFNIEKAATWISEEQMKTSFNMIKRVHSLTDNDRYDYDDIIVEIDGKTFTQPDFHILTQLPEILQDSGEIGSFELGNLKITINSLNTYEHNLIKV